MIRSDAAGGAELIRLLPRRKLLEKEKAKAAAKAAAEGGVVEATEA